MSKIVKAYREAAMELYGISRQEAERAIVEPKDGNGWADRSLVVIYLEYGDNMAAHIGYHALNGMDECFRLSGKAGKGYIEYMNAAVGAVYE